eukprot:gene15726-17311_t
MQDDQSPRSKYPPAFAKPESVVMTDEIRLHQSLLSNYTPSQLPVLDGQERMVDVTIGPTLKQVIDVEETNEHVVVNVFIRQIWYNHLLKWDPEKFGGIKKINIRPKQVWTPDIYLYANVEDSKSYNGFLDTLKTRITLHNDGKNVWLSPIMFRISCAINVAKFPFDTQVCDFVFGSFTYDNTKLRLKPENKSADVTDYSKNVEWKLLSMDSLKRTTKHTCCENSFDEVVYTLIIKRKPLFLIINLIAPNMIFSFMTIMVYIIPVGTGERSSFVVSLVLAMALFLTSSIDLMPDSSEVIPLFSYFLGLVLLAMFLLTITVCYSLSIYYANANVLVMPCWMRKYVLNKLAPFLGIELRPQRKTLKSVLNDEEARFFTTQVNDGLGCCHPGRLWSAGNNLKYKGSLWKSDDQPRNDDTIAGMRFDKKSLNKVSDQLTSIIDSMEKEDERAHRQAEWSAVSRSLDKLCFWVFICAFLLILTFCSFKGASLQ